MNHNASPVNAMPPVIVALFLFMLGIEIAFQAASNGIIGGPGGIGWRLSAIQDYGWNSQIGQYLIETGNFAPDLVIRLISYSFVHQSVIHLAISMAIFLAMGRMVGAVYHGILALLIFVVSAVVGAIVFSLIAPAGSWLIGAFPGTYGLIGAYTFLIWLHLRAQNEATMRAFSLIGMLMAIQLVFGALFGSDWTWVAELTAFFVGFALAFVMTPGAMSALMEKLRRR